MLSMKQYRPEIELLKGEPFFGPVLIKAVPSLASLDVEMLTVMFSCFQTLVEPEPRLSV